MTYALPTRGAASQYFTPYDYEILYIERTWPGAGVTKAPFVDFSVSIIFDLVKAPVKLFQSHSYLTGATAAELRRHLSNMSMIFNS